MIPQTHTAAHANASEACDSNSGSSCYCARPRTPAARLVMLASIGHQYTAMGPQYVKFCPMWLGPRQYAAVKFQAFCGPRQKLRPLRAAPLSCSPHGGLAGSGGRHACGGASPQETIYVETVGRCGFERLVVDGSVVHEYRCVSSAYLRSYLCRYSPPRRSVHLCRLQCSALSQMTSL